MTDEQIAELERLNKAAHPAPWTWQGETIHAGDSMIPAARHIIALVREAHDSDKALMTIARNVLPRLLEERKLLLEALRQVIEQYESASPDWWPPLEPARQAITYAEATCPTPASGPSS